MNANAKHTNNATIKCASCVVPNGHKCWFTISWKKMVWSKYLYICVELLIRSIIYCLLLEHISDGFCLKAVYKNLHKFASYFLYYSIKLLIISKHVFSSIVITFAYAQIVTDVKNDYIHWYICYSTTLQRYKIPHTTYHNYP